MTTTIEQAKTKEEFELALVDEKADRSWEEIMRMSKAVNPNARNMARVRAYHEFGYGNCPCSHCSQG